MARSVRMAFAGVRSRQAVGRTLEARMLHVCTKAAFSACRFSSMSRSGRVRAARVLPGDKLIDWVSRLAGMRPLSLTRKLGPGGRAAANLGLSCGKAGGWRWLSRLGVAGVRGRGGSGAAAGKGLVVNRRVLRRPPAG